MSGAPLRGVVTGAARLRLWMRWRACSPEAVLLVLLALAAGMRIIQIGWFGSPLGDGGYFASAAEAIRQNDYRLPDFVPYRGQEPLPLVYPPLGFYIMAGLADLTHASIPSLMRVGAPLLSIAGLVPCYHLGKRLLGSPRAALIATLVFATNPVSFSLLIQGGGLIRGMAFVLTMTGLVVMLKTMAAPKVRGVAAAGLLFGLTLAVHPVYALVFAAGAFAVWLGVHRSRPALLAGLAIGALGAAITSPWWITIAATHGFDALVGPFEFTYGGDALKTLSAIVRFHWWSDEDIFPIWYAAALLGLALCMLGGKWALPAWAAGLAAAFGVPATPFGNVAPFLAGEFMTTFFLPQCEAAARTLPWRRAAAAIVIGAIGLYALYGAFRYVYDASSLKSDPIARPELRPVLTREFRDAAAWAKANTSPDSQFIILGQPYRGEWFPYLAERTIAFSIYGAEWVPDLARRYQRMQDDLDDCRSRNAACLTSLAQRHRLALDYVLVPYEELASPLAMSIKASPGFAMAYESPNIAIFQWRARPSVA